MFKEIKKLFCVFFLFISVFANLIAKEPESEAPYIDSLAWPMEFKHPITGSFAEYRNHSLHLGCDFKTYWMNGFPVKAIFDGYITTLRYSDFGYGLSFDMHSTKYNITSRYAHLNDLKGDVSGFEQLKDALLLLAPKDSFSLKLKKEFFPVKIGQKIARTGESGTGTPHLHLEVFDSSGFINPLTFKNFKQNDVTPPIIQAIYLDSDNGKAEELLVTKNDEGKYVLKEERDIRLTGKIKVKAASYDIITAKNPNGLYGIELFYDNQSIYKKELSRLSYSEIGERHKLYDVNRSSLSPANYVYNFYDYKKGYSIDLTKEQPNSKKVLTVQFKDASGNTSSTSVMLTVGEPLPQSAGSKKNKFSSDDNQVVLDFSGLMIEGKGKVEIKKTELPQEIVSPKLVPVSNVYKIETVDFNWRGMAIGKFSGNYSSSDKDLYIYDVSTKQWMKLTYKKQGSGIDFKLSRLGYICIMEDKSPPQIGYPYLLFREYELENKDKEKFIERFYSINEEESGLKKIEVLLEGIPYPYEYNSDRKYVKIQIPMKVKKHKNIFLIQVRVTDKAGNSSEWFNDILTIL